MPSTLTSNDPVLSIRARIEAVYAAEDASPMREASTALPALWSELPATRPTTAEGLAIVLDEADAWEEELIAAGIRFPGQFAKFAGQVRSGTLSPRDVEFLTFSARMSEMELPGHSLSKLLAKAVEFSKAPH